ncbi:signal peptidase II [Thermocrinis minervae]|uniref:Lipoprotein signal peptidase n=1 Tax=Thermocrinis minervae TaxID=381751 RepID=A0A1M6PZ65_9AQUI|nr:signal peptidase II [Thermocrinis minervae]SHK13228.1 signal peptidase II [Thermocrinis minervae]
MEALLRKSAFLYWLIVSLVVLIDLFTKNLAEAFLQYGDITLLPFLHLVLVHNKGVAFGFLSEAPDSIRLPVLILTPLIATTLTFFYALKNPSPFNSIVMGMIGGGAIGNFYDRLFLGYVRDFIYVSYKGLAWPAFNVADASISLAMALLLIRWLLKGQ